MGEYWDSEEVFLDGDLYFDHLLKDIDEAKKFITVEVYIFNDDALGRKIATHLIAAHRRGVKIQIMVDGVGSYSFFDRLYHLFSREGIRVKMFHPLPLYHPVYGKQTLTQKFRIFFTRLWRLNQRNHRKMITIDSNILYMGSFNFTAEHTQFHFDTKWKDMGARVTGQNVKIALLHFKKIWRLKEFFRYRKIIKKIISTNLKKLPLRLNHTLFMKKYYYRDLLTKINNSKERIWLMTPYFIPKGRLIRAIAKASRRGVDVKILISSKSDVTAFRSLQFFYYPYLIKNNVRIFQYEQTVLHAKIFIIDEWVTVGSSNLNHRSILHDLEVDLSIQEQANKELIVQDFIQSTPINLEITTVHLKQRTLFDKFLSRLFFIFKYWF